MCYVNRSVSGFVDEGNTMIQIVRALNKFYNQLFRWDSETRILSLSHGKYVWFVKLNDDNKFKVIDCKYKSKSNPKK